MAMAIEFLDGIEVAWKQVIVNEETSHETHEFINKRLSAIKSQRNSGELEDLALIIGELPLIYLLVFPQLSFHRW